MNATSLRILGFTGATALVFGAACATNPATGEREISLIGEGQEIQMGQEADPQIRASMGVVDDAQLQAYVNSVGQRLAAVSERPELPWKFTVIDDPAVNAFAVPGGFIYVTRGILTQFDNEAELSGVLGHEIGHVTARHSVSQMSRQQLQQLGLGLGAIFSSTVASVADVASVGLGLLNLKYSRGDETQADELGVRYMTRTDYDPQQLRGVFEMLASVSGGPEARVPEWQLTHPYPENRAEHLTEVIAAQQGAGQAHTVARGDYLRQIDGMIYGPNPREGYFKGTRFLHPELAFELTFPNGWQTVNQRTVVGAISPNQDAVVTLQLAQGSDPVAALRSFLSQQGVQGGQIWAGDQNGVSVARAEFEAATEQGQIRGETMYVVHQGTLYQLLGYSPVARWSANARAIGDTYSSFGRVTDRAVLDVRPWTVDIVSTPSAMTLRQFNSRYPSVVDLEELAQINRMSPDETAPAGYQLKRVVGDPLP